MSEDKGQKIEICPNGRVWDVGHFVWRREGVIFMRSHFCVAVKRSFQAKNTDFFSCWMRKDEESWGQHILYYVAHNLRVRQRFFSPVILSDRIFTHSIYNSFPNLTSRVDGKAQLEIVVFLSWLHGGGKYFPNYLEICWKCGIALGCMFQKNWWNAKKISSGLIFWIPSRILIYLQISVSPCVHHRRDISHSSNTCS